MFIIEHNTEKIYDKEYRARLIFGRNPKIEIRHKTLNGYNLLIKIEYVTKHRRFDVFLNSSRGSIGFRLDEFNEILEIIGKSQTVLQNEIIFRNKVQNV